MTKGLQSAARIICAPAARKFHTCSLRSIFSAAHVAGENDRTFFRRCGGETLRGFWTSCGSPADPAGRGCRSFGDVSGSKVMCRSRRGARGGKARLGCNKPRPRGDNPAGNRLRGCLCQKSSTFLTKGFAACCSARAVRPRRTVRTFAGRAVFSSPHMSPEKMI